MAKQLFPPCDKVLIKTVQISRKESEGTWTSYAVIMGEAQAADGTKLQDIHTKIPVGVNGPDPWDQDTIEKDIEEVATIVKNAVKAIEDEHTIE